MGTKIKLPKINKKNFPYQLVICYWEDIVSESSWADIIDIDPTHYGKFSS